MPLDFDMAYLPPRLIFRVNPWPLGTQLANLSNAKLELLYALETSVEYSEDQYIIHHKQRMANLQANVYVVPGCTLDESYS